MTDFQFEKYTNLICDLFVAKLKLGETPENISEGIKSNNVGFANPVQIIETAKDPETTKKPEPTKESGKIITSPLVGTFYSAPSPQADAFVKVGDTVKVGDVLCIISAMKVMNEIESDQSGVVTKIMVENGSLVEYGQGLFCIE